jgi:hypothetical protein
VEVTDNSILVARLFKNEFVVVQPLSELEAMKAVFGRERRIAITATKLALLDLFRRDDLNVDRGGKAFHRYTAKGLHVIAMGMQRQAFQRFPFFDEDELVRV